MTIRYKCEECGAALNIKDELAGTRGHCPRCKVEFTVPVPEPSPAAGQEKEVGKKAAAVAAEPTADAKKRLAGPIGEDEIEAILGAAGPGSSGSDYAGG